MSLDVASSRQPRRGRQETAAWGASCESEEGAVGGSDCGSKEEGAAGGGVRGDGDYGALGEKRTGGRGRNAGTEDFSFSAREPVQEM